MDLASVKSSTRIEAPAGALFDIVTDYTKVRAVVDGLEGLAPLETSKVGVGARFEATLSLGPKKVISVVVLAEATAPVRARWVDADDSSRSLLFELKELEEALTAVRLTISYAAPAGLKAVLVRPVVDEALRAHARETLERLRKAVVS